MGGGKYFLDFYVAYGFLFFEWQASLTIFYLDQMLKIAFLIMPFFVELTSVELKKDHKINIFGGYVFNRKIIK